MDTSSQLHTTIFQLSTVNRTLLQIIATMQDLNSNRNLDQHTKDLLKDITSGMETDITIICKDGKELKANSYLLKLRSKVFAKMLDPQWSSGGNLQLPADNVEDVSLILDYVYYAKVPQIIKDQFDYSQMNKYDALLDLAGRFDLAGLVYEIGAQRVRGLYWSTDQFLSNNRDWSAIMIIPSDIDLSRIKDRLAKRFRTTVRLTYRKIGDSVDYLYLDYSGDNLGHIYTFKVIVPEGLKEITR